MTVPKKTIADWRRAKDFNPEIVLSKISAIRNLGTDGVSVFHGLDLYQYLPLLQSMLEFSSTAAEVETSDLAWIGLKKCGGDLTAEAFLEAIRSELLERLATEEMEFNLLTTVSVDPKTLPQSDRTENSTIRYLRSFPSKYDARFDLISQKKLVVADHQNTYGCMVVRVKAKSAIAAYAKGMASIDLVRALWCLQRNPAMQYEFGTPQHVPINVIRLGAIHTIHDVEGALCEDAVWYEPKHMAQKLYRFKRARAERMKFLHFMRAISKCRYGGQIRDSLLRFVRSLDDPDPNTAFIRLWGALESLTTPGTANYDLLKKRCIFLFRERDYYKQLLEVLRTYRNANVHMGEDREYAKIHCYHLQFIFSQVVYFHLAFAEFFDSLEEANSFLDMPTNTATICRRMAIHRKALRYISK